MRLPARSVAVLLLAIGVATCSDAPSVGPRPATAPGKGRLAIVPVFSSAAAAVLSQRTAFAEVTFDHVRIVLVRPPRDTVKDTTIVFTPGATPKTLDLTIEVRNVGESFDGIMDYTSNGVVVFHGKATVRSHAADEQAPPAQEIMVQYVGPGFNATRLTVSPKTVTVQAPGTSSFTALAFDAAGNPVAGVPLSWSSSDPTVATVNANTGALTTTGRRGTATVTARTPMGVSDNGVATITLPPTGITLVSGGAQTGKAGAALAQPGVVRVVASDGVGVAGVAVNFAAPAGGSVGSPSVTTDANGQASTTLTLGGIVGPQSFAAAAGAFNVSIPATATAADPASILAFSGSGQSDTVRRALKSPFVAKVADRFGNAIPGVTVTWARTAGTGALSGTSSVTSGDGTASVGYTLGTSVGTETVTATASGIATPATFTATALTSGPAAIVAVSGSGQVGRATQVLAAPFVVRVSDDQGAPVSGATVAWTATNGTLSASTTTDAQGQSSNTMTLGGTVGAALATATSGGKSVNFTATVQPGIVAQLGFRAAPPTAAPGAVLTPAVQVDLRDAAGNLTAAANAVTLALGANPGGATLTGTLTRTSVGGVATFDDLRLDKVGVGYTLVATSAGVPNVTSAALNIGTVLPPTNIAVVTMPTSVVNGVAWTPQPVVRLMNGQTNVPLAGVTVTLVAANPLDGDTPFDGEFGTPFPLITNGSAVTDANGIATFTGVRITGRVARFNAVFTATGTGFSPITLVVPGPQMLAGGAVALQAINGNFQTGPPSIALPINPTVQLLDISGNPTATPVATVTFATLTGSVAPASVATDANGQASTFWTMPSSPGPALMTAGITVGGVPVTVTFTATAASTLPSDIFVVGSALITTPVNTPLGAYPRVRVIDAAQAAIPNVQVRFTAVGACTAPTPYASVTTDANGEAALTSALFTLPVAAGASCQVVATTPGLATQAAMSVIVLPSGANQKTWTGAGTSDWSDGASWLPTGSMPTSTSDVFIPSYARNITRLTQGSTTIGSLTVEGFVGQVFNIFSNNLTINGSLSAGLAGGLYSTVNSNTQGLVILNATGTASMSGFVGTNIRFGPDQSTCSGSYTLTGTVAQTYGARVNCPLDVGSTGYNVAGAFTVQNQGRLIMNQSTAAVITSSTATFQGVNGENGSITAGVFSAGADLILNNAGSATPFVQGPNATLIMGGAGSHSITVGTGITLPIALGNFLIGANNNVTINNGTFSVAGVFQNAGTGLTVASGVGITVSGSSLFSAPSTTSVLGSMTLNGSSAFTSGSTVSGTGIMTVVPSTCTKQASAVVNVTGLTPAFTASLAQCTNQIP